MKNNYKILFIIPAYNEENNIKNVLDEIRKDVDYASVLVIDDCSTDNTKSIVESTNTDCISSIYNMKYAWAIQTGIKYAQQNNFDFVMQFDADGQHIAKEAQKLIEYAINYPNCDIVIGSRYLENTGYECPLFRKIGTKIFSLMIKVLCGKTITDPLSGFQCLSKNAINKFSKIGSYPEYPDANLIIDLIFQGYYIKELPVKMRLRKEGESMHGGVIKPIKYMINLIYSILIISIQNIGRKKERKNE